MWTTHFTGTIGGRTVTVQTSDEGDLRVRTNQGIDDEGGVEATIGALTITPPLPAHRKVAIDATSLEEMLDELQRSGFSAEDAAAILAKFP